MYKLLPIVTLVFLIVGCNTIKKEQKVTLNEQQIDSLSFFQDTECKDKIAEFGVTKKTIIKYVSEVTTNNDGIEKMILLFYKEEGEVINLYKNAIIKQRDKTKVIYSLNDGGMKTEEIKSEFVLNSFLEKIEEQDIPTNKDILIIEVEKENSNCILFKNIKALETSSNKLVFR
jgi:hypothetical protein